MEIDRISPTRRPPRFSVMRQRWAELLFLHWQVEPDVLRCLLPEGLELDTWDGAAYIGLVPFTMTGIRPTPLPPFPPLSNFHEVNVRTYVHYRGEHPGVWFFSLDAANLVAVKIARAWFKLPYHFARMNLRVTPERTEYRSQRLTPAPLPADCDLSYTPHGAVTPVKPGTLDHFLCERYLLYAHDGKSLYRGQVHHPPYPLQTATLHHCRESLIAAAGIVRPDTPPLIHFAREVRVHIFPLERIPFRK
jgi:uncharacterized protein